MSDESPAAKARSIFPGGMQGGADHGRDRHVPLAARRRPGVPLNAVEVEDEIMRFVGLLEERTDELAGRARLAAEAEANHKGRWASAFLQAEGTESKRKAEADVATHDLYLKRKIEEGLYQSCKESCNSIRAQLDAMRSISANIRAQT